LALTGSEKNTFVFISMYEVKIEETFKKIVIDAFINVHDTLKMTCLTSVIQNIEN
jgi:uncharacterized membrane protein YesL